MKPTLEQVREAILWGTIPGCCETCDKYIALAASLEGYALVPVADCPNCPNQGFYASRVGEDDIEQTQCEFCYTVPNSRFNLNAMLTASEADK